MQSIWEAVQVCGANRIGHGVGIMDEVLAATGGERARRLAAYVRNEQIALEMCPSSNVQTGAVALDRGAPVPVLAELGSGSRSTPTTG